MQAVVDRTGQCRRLEELALRMIGCERDSESNRDPCDPAGRVRRHNLVHPNSHASQIDSMTFGSDAHDRGHAEPERRSREVGWGKCLALPVIIDRSIGEDFYAGGTVDCLAPETAEIGNIGVNHR